MESLCCERLSEYTCGVLVTLLRPGIGWTHQTSPAREVPSICEELSVGIGDRFRCTTVRNHIDYTIVKYYVNGSLSELVVCELCG